MDLLEFTWEIEHWVMLFCSIISSFYIIWKNRNEGSNMCRKKYTMKQFGVSLECQKSNSWCAIIISTSYTKPVFSAWPYSSTSSKKESNWRENQKSNLLLVLPLFCHHFLKVHDMALRDRFVAGIKKKWK